jgi:AmmeMemoRadiSam system protein A
MELSVSDKKELLRIARTSIEQAMKGVPISTRETSTGILSELRGAFVTLRLQNELRGCIGYVEPRLPLQETVREVAEKAAFEDPRFPPLSEDELKEVEIEISVLSPLRKISSVDEIEIGKHGLILDAGYTRGLLLPQVATEYGWGREEFLSHTARKAGLPSDAWKHRGIEFLVFTSDVFSEAEFAPSNH